MKSCLYLYAKYCFSNIFGILMAIVFFCSLLSVRTAAAENNQPHGANNLVKQQIFRTIYLLPPEKRVDSAFNLYKATCRKIPVADAMAALDQLNKLALQFNDRPMLCAIYQMRADYYSVNNAFNKLSIHYYQQAIDFAKQNSLPVEAAISVHLLGMYYYTFERYAAAYPYLLDARDMFNDIGFNRVPNISGYLNDLAVFYYNIGDYDNAKIQLDEALQYKTYSHRGQISMINSIGLIYRNDKQYNLALKYFNTSLRLAKLYRDSAWVGIAQGNVGSVYLMQGDYQKALPFIRTDYTLSLRYNENINAAISLLRLTKISVLQKKFGLAATQLDTVSSLIAGQSGVLEQWIDYNDLRADIAERYGNLSEALQFRKKLESAKDSLAARNNLADLERTRLRRLMDAHLVQVSRLKASQRIGDIERNSIIVVLILLVIIFVLVYNRQLLKEKRDKESLVAEKRIVDEELKNSVSELMRYTESLTQQNNLIDKFKAKIQSRYETMADAGIVEKLMRGNLTTNQNWDEFKKLFLKVHTGFFIDVRKSFPKLTETDMKLLALMKLHLSNREMAGMLGVTPEGIKKARQRLRKKMALSADTSIEEALNAI